VSTVRRLLSVGLLLLPLALVCGACGGANSSPRPAATQPTPGKVLTPVSSRYAASGPLAIGDAEGAVPPGDVSPAPDSGRVESAGRRFRLPGDGPPVVINAFGVPRGSGMIHGGVDFQASGGAEVRSLCSGTVLESGITDAYGEHVVVDCGDGWTALLGYLGSRAVATGAAVTPSTVIGRVDHELRFVHVELRVDGRLVDPEPRIRLGTESVVNPATPAPALPPEMDTPTGVDATRTASPATPSTQPAATSPAPLAPTPTAVPPTTTPTPPPTPTPGPPTSTPTAKPRPVIR